jgi:hypothetical protein
MPPAVLGEVERRGKRGLRCYLARLALDPAAAGVILGKSDVSDLPA